MGNDPGDVGLRGPNHPFGEANINVSARRPATIHPLLLAIFEGVLDGNHEKCPLLATCNRQAVIV